VIPRGLAYVIDTAVVAVLTAVLMTAGILEGGGLESLDPDAVREMLQSNSGFAVYVILFAYFLLLEGLWGRTLGKLALGLRVVKVQDGSPCGWSRSVVRNLIRPFDLFFLGLPGGMVVLLTPARQRIGDLLGGTLVVRPVTVPAAMAAVIPGLLRRCPSCGRLAPAAGACPACGTPPPPGAGQALGAAILQPLAGMMAAGEAAAALRVAAQEVLAAESAYGAASAAESARLGREEAAVPASAPSVPAAAEGEGDDAAGGTAGPAGAAGPGGAAAETGPVDSAAGEEPGGAFVHTADAPGLSEDYVAAWRGLMAAVETLRARRVDLDAKLGSASVPFAQVTAADPLLRGLLDQVEPYLDADDDEAVLGAFMARVSGAGAAPADESGAQAQDPAS
jgi:uncharacterized RDD family membrane protein YckC